MNATSSWLPGHLPLGAGRSVSLAPRACGELTIGRGRVALDGRQVAAGERRRLWRGDKVELANVAAQGTALYAWDPCVDPPTLRERIKRALARALQRAHSQLSER